MASYIVKAKGIDLSVQSDRQISAARFYSGDRFYTLMNEYIDKNLSRKNILLGFIIKVLFRSSNFKHDPQIANGKQLSVAIFDFICCVCLIVFCGLISAIIISGIVDLAEKLRFMYSNQSPDKWGYISATSMLFGTIFSNWTRLLSMGVLAIVVGVIGILWLLMIVKIRAKNKVLSLQAYVEKKISICLSLRFLIKLANKKKTKGDIVLLENFEAQGAAGARWSNIQLINLIASIFNDFSFVFRFDELSDADYEELCDVIIYDFAKIEIIKSDDFKFKKFEPKQRKNIFKSKSSNKNDSNLNSTQPVQTTNEMVSKIEDTNQSN